MNKYGGLIPLLVVGAVLLLQASNVQGIAVMSVDIGSEWMKVAIVSPGVPMEIVLNKESKRKTPVAIAFRDGERTFGEDALNVGVRFPQNCYIYLLDLLGKTVDNPIVQNYMKRFPYYTIVPDPRRGTVVFQHDENTKYSVEELIGMILNKAKEYAQITAEQPITDVVISVPGYFNQAERRAMVQAAELAGLKVLQLMNDYTAAALNYGMFRRKDFNETAQYLMLYNMGAVSSWAAVISYQMVKTKEKGFVETNPQLSILGVAFDRTLGGLEMQFRLRDHLAQKFKESAKSTNDIFKNHRSMAKLFKESGRLKNVLSANVEHHAQVEGLIDEIDFKQQVTREEFELLCADLIERVTLPVEYALKNSGLTMDLINQVILVGAGTRVPAVQNKLTEKYGVDLGKSLNTDEAVVLGAAFKAADLSKGFKVKKFLVKDAVVFPIQVLFEREAEKGPKQIKRMLFGLMNPFPQKKIISFSKHSDDFTFNLTYAELDHLNPMEVDALGPLTMSSIRLTQVKSSLDSNKAPNIESKGIKAHFSMDDSGILSLANVELVLEKTVSAGDEEESAFSKLGSKISNFFGGENTPEKEAKDGEDKKVEPEEEKKDSDSPKDSVNKTSDTNSTAEDKKPVIVPIKVEIPAEQVWSFALMNEQEFESSLSKLKKLNDHDMEKSRRERALNALESFVFEARNRLDTAEYKAASTKEESEAILALCTKFADWLDEEGWEADATTFESKLSELKKLTKPIWNRVFEHHERPEALAAFDAAVNASQNFLKSIKNMTEHHPESEDPMFTKVEVEVLEKAIKEVVEWKEKSVKEQKELPLSTTPKLTIRLIMEKKQALDREVMYLVNKAKIWQPKTKPVKPEKSESEKPKDKEDKKPTKSEKEEKKFDDDPTRIEAEDTLELPEAGDSSEPTVKPSTTSEADESLHTEL